MKIVHILDNLERGGAQTVLRSLVAGLARRGYEQHLVVLNEKHDPDVVAAMQAAGATVEIIGRPQLYAGIGFWRLIRLLRRRAPDWVHTILPWGDLIGRSCARQAGVRRIVSTVTARYADKPRWQLALDRATIGWAQRVVFVSAEIVPFSQAREGVRPEQVLCIPNGVEWDETDRTAAAAALRQRHGRGARRVAGMVARLHPQKAHGDLLRAYQAVRTDFPDTVLWLVGDGPERPRLEALTRQLGLAEHVVFAGDRADPLDWIAAMDLFVHPTYFEGLPLAVLEAMAAARPVIASAVDGLKGLIENNLHGWLTPPGDVPALAAAMRAALARPDVAARMAAAGAARVRAEFGADRMVRGYAALFEAAPGI